MNYPNMHTSRIRAKISRKEFKQQITNIKNIEVYSDFIYTRKYICNGKQLLPDISYNALDILDLEVECGVPSYMNDASYSKLYFLMKYIDTNIVKDIAKQLRFIFLDNVVKEIIENPSVNINHTVKCISHNRKMYLIEHGLIDTDYTLYFYIERSLRKFQKVLELEFLNNLNNYAKPIVHRYYTLFDIELKKDIISKSYRQTHIRDMSYFSSNIDKLNNAYGYMLYNY